MDYFKPMILFPKKKYVDQENSKQDVGIADINVNKSYVE